MDKLVLPEFDYLAELNGDLNHLESTPNMNVYRAIQLHAVQLGLEFHKLFDLTTGEGRTRDMYNSEGNFCSDGVRYIAGRLTRRNLADSTHQECQIIKQSLLRIVQRDILKLDESYSGIITPSGSDANRLALHLARETSQKRKVVCSNLSHFSIRNALGQLGMEAVTYKRSMGDITATPVEDIDRLLHEHEGSIAALVLTAGDTNLGTFEEVPEEILDECERQGIWVHLDAAYGISYALQSSPPEEMNRMLRSGRMQSVTTDPHKFIGTTPCGSLYLQEGRDRIDHMKNNISYFQGEPETYFTTSFDPAGTATAFYSCHVNGKNGLRLGADELSMRSQYLEMGLAHHDIGMITPSRGRNVAIQLSSDLERERVLREALDAGFSLASVHADFKDDNSVYGVRILNANTPEFSREVLDELISVLNDSVETRI